MHRPKLPKLAVSKSGSLGRERLRLCVRLTGMKVKETKNCLDYEVAHRLAGRRLRRLGGALARPPRRGDGNFEIYFVNKKPRPRNLCTQPQWREESALGRRDSHARSSR